MVQAAAFSGACGSCADDNVGDVPSNNGTFEPGTELVAFGAASGTTSEMGAQASFDVVLAVKPTADVVVKLGSNDPGEGLSDVSVLTFTPENWDAPQTVTVTGQDDDLADGDQAYAIVFEALESEDARFAGYEPGEVALVNVDDETAGFTVTEADGDTTEVGGQASFTVALRSKPTADVTLTLESSDPGEGTIDKSTLTFTPENWNAPQTVTATGQDDDVADGDQVYEVVFGDTSSDDADYAAIKPESVELTNIDDETAGFTVSEADGDTSEAGAQASFTVALNSKPTADVTLTLESSDPGEGTIDKSTLTFTPDNWNAPQTVTATGQDDDVADGNQVYEVVFGDTSSEDADYAAIKPDSVEYTNIDDETPGTTVAKLGEQTTEAGGQAQFTIVLNSEPFEDVTLNFASNDAGEGTVGQNALTFTAQNWNAPQTVTVTGQDDDFADGDQPYAIVFSATTSADAAYAAITPQNVALTNVDDDSAGITVSAISGSTSEAGGQATFSIVLNSEPFDDVTVNFASNDAGEGAVGQNALTFTAQNWNAPQTVTVTGQDDDFADGDQPYAIVFSATTSADAAYAAITPQNVALTNVDDDSAGITVSAISGSTSEAGGQATFSIVLNSRPYGDVTVSFDSNDTGEGTVGQNALTFTDQNWNAPQTVTVTGQDDDFADGDQPYAIVFSATTSADAAYAAITPQNVALTNVDDDSAGITVSAPSGPTSEAGAQATFSVVLNSKPYGDVTVNFDSSDAGEGTVGTTSLTFTDADWNAPQSVTITGQDDDLADGDQPYAIVFAATTSADAAYAAITPQNVAAVNTDDDSAGVTVSAISGATSEAGTSQSFSVVLNSEPFNDVTLNFDSNDPGEGAVSTTSLTFTAGNWSAPQTVTVTGQDDDLADGDQPYAIVFGATTSNDAAYAAITPANVAVTNIDDDSAGIIVSAISGDTSELGTTATFSVVLTSQPFDDVTLGFDSDDTTEGVVGATSLTFTPANWDTPQVVTVTGVDDTVLDGDQSYQIIFLPAVSSDAGYNGQTPTPVAVTNIDDDIPSVGFVGTTGRTTGDPWTVCRADASTAWVSAMNAGSYNPTAACQSLGYSSVDAWGGTCGDVCGFCGNSGFENYDNNGGNATNLSVTVHWRCTN
ncbi:hypothetical protein DN745_16765 [Bradymonas sediminis]|uniref:Calx-beta domain-containing protein n=1 Tax=Bradymonas sediminis TaxID=1548548 RepID=A0A2Z4FQG9_9DELT|nr:hypothetical protein DN745_16765 [Bradymonas sediminis]